MPMLKHGKSIADPWEYGWKCAGKRSMGIVPYSQVVEIAHIEITTESL
jgi:hypothetical protein